MKKLLSMILVFTLACTLLAGCGSSDGGDSDSEYKDTIVFCQGNDITTLDGSQAPQERSVALLNHIFDPLFVTDENFEIAPCLATEWEWQDGEKTLKVKLREGVKFHDGSDMTAEDVKFTLDLLQERGATFSGNYKDTEILNDYEVLIHLNAPNPALLNILSTAQTCIIPSDAYDPDAFALNPIGTGPYKFLESAEGDYYTLERFDDYWGEPAKTKYLTMRIVPEPSQRAILLETGEVDAAYGLSFNDLNRMKDDSNYTIYTSPSMKVILMELNCASDGPVGNPKVRRAIECAIDKDSIIESLLSGWGEPSKSIVSPYAKDYREMTVNEYDPELAKKLLAEAGYADGFELSLFTNSDQINSEIATVMQEQLAKVGITLKITVQDDNTTFSMVENGDDFDMILDFFQATSCHASYVFNDMLRSTAFNNYSRYYDKEFDSLLEKYSATAEGPEREELLNKIYDKIATDTPAIGLYIEYKTVATTSKMEGFHANHVGAHELQNARVRK